MRASTGFTLIEVLMAMAIMGIIFVLILNWQTSTLQTTTRANNMAQQMEDLNDLTGYIGDRVRSARAVRLTGFTVNSASAPNAGKCDPVTPCLAVLVMDEEVTPAIGATPKKLQSSWLRLIYRVEPRSTWSSADKLDDAWADNAANNVVVVREYRDKCDELTSNVSITVPTALCQTFVSDFSTIADFSGMSPQLVTDYLSSINQSGNPIVPFAPKSTADPVGPGNPLVFTFQAKRNPQGRLTFLPSSAPLTLTVQPRNLSP